MSVFVNGALFTWLACPGEEENLNVGRHKKELVFWKGLETDR
mgnify:CR=1 FL=1